MRLLAGMLAAALIAFSGAPAWAQNAPNRPSSVKAQQRAQQERASQQAAHQRQVGQQQRAALQSSQQRNAKAPVKR